MCEEYKLHRETYYVAMDMYDRFMDSQTSVLKEQLQLIGVTCLFVASKIEVCVCGVLKQPLWYRRITVSYYTYSLSFQEIYPPKVTEFAYVTDGACGVADILDMELVLCKVSLFLSTRTCGLFHLGDCPYLTSYHSLPSTYRH